jgi:hypothetical protein
LIHGTSFLDTGIELHLEQIVIERAVVHDGDSCPVFFQIRLVVLLRVTETIHVVLDSSEFLTMFQIATFQGQEEFLVDVGLGSIQTECSEGWSIPHGDVGQSLLVLYDASQLHYTCGMEMVPYPNRVVTDHIDIGIRYDRDIAPAIESSMSSTHHVTDITTSARRYTREILAESLVIAHVVDRESGHDLAMIHPFRGNFEDIVILVMKDRFQVREVDVDRLTTYDVGVDDHTTFYGFSPDLCAEVLGCSAVVLLADIGKSQDFPRHHVQDPLDRIGDQVHLLLPLIKMKLK